MNPTSFINMTPSMVGMTIRNTPPFNDDGQSITLEVKDGGYGDSDGLANGVIVDPGGIASVGDSYSNLGSNIVGCFIATAAFGSKFEKHVQLLRRFRDSLSYAK